MSIEESLNQAIPGKERRRSRKDDGARQTQRLLNSTNTLRPQLYDSDDQELTIGTHARQTQSNEDSQTMEMAKQNTLSYNDALRLSSDALRPHPRRKDLATPRKRTPEEHWNRIKREPASYSVVVSDRADRDAFRVEQYSLRETLQNAQRRLKEVEERMIFVERDRDRLNAALGVIALCLIFC